ncbi:MAG: hypothetical protein AAF799_26970 [Myxococcota bacterium]
MWLPSLLLAVTAPTESPLRWDAPASGCPDAEALAAYHEALLGDATTEVEAHALVRPRGSGWHALLTIHWRGHVNRRELQAPDCARLAEAAVLVVAVMSDPETLTQRLDEPHPPTIVRPHPVEAPAKPPDVQVDVSPAGPRPTRTEPPPEPPTTRPRAPRRRAQPRLDRGPTLVGGLIVDGGSMPRIAPGPVVGVGWRTPWMKFFAEGMTLVPQQVEGSTPETQGEVLVGAARAGACVRAGVGRRVELSQCVGPELGGATALGFGVGGDETARNLWIGAFGRGSIAIDVTPMMAVTVGAELLVLLRQFDYRYRGQTFHRTWPVPIRGLAGVEIRWGS